MENEEEGETVGGISLPLARVKKIIKSDKEVKSISNNGALMIAKATVFIWKA